MQLYIRRWYIFCMCKISVQIDINKDILKKKSVVHWIPVRTIVYHTYFTSENEKSAFRNIFIIIFTINVTNKSQEVSPFAAGDHKAAMNRRESMTNTRQKYHEWSIKEVPPWNGQKNILLDGLNQQAFYVKLVTKTL